MRCRSKAAECREDDAMGVAGDGRPDYERSDVSVRLIAAIGGGLALLFIGSPLLLRAAFDQPPAAPATPVPPAPRLQSNPSADWSAFRAEQMTRLNGERWVDREHGIAHIPIDDAMRLLAARGRPGWPAPSR
jgi:hypothetical protein